MYYLTDVSKPQYSLLFLHTRSIFYISVSQPPGPGINYTGPREVLLEFVILVF